MSFINKVVLITGASTEIGEAISIHFSKLSARLSLVDIESEKLKKTAEICEKISKVKVLVTVADLRNDEHVNKVVHDTKKEYGRIDVVINCVGIYKPSSILETDSIEIYDNLMSLNLRSVVKMTVSVASSLVETEGCIIIVQSSGATLTASGSIPYSVTVGSLNHFTTSAALDLASVGVRVNSILPGIIKMNTESSSTFSNKISPPLKRNTKCEEIAELAAFLASDKAKSMTGCSYPIDAGLALM